MSRPERRRAEREDQKRDLPLTATEIVRLNAQRTLPAKHPSADKDYFIPSPLDLVWHAIEVIEQSGVLPYLERRLRPHPGQKSALSVFALLVTMVVAAFVGPSYRRADLCAVLHGFEAEAAYRLGLCSRVARKLFSYNLVDKQSLRLERALAEGWVDADGTKCNQDWFAHILLKANIAAEEAEKITTIAIDSTFLLAWAVPYSYPEGEQPPSGQRSADPAARFGHRSATAKRKAGKRLGFDLHVVCGIRGSKKWQGDPKNPNLEEESVSLVPLHMKLVPANPDVAPIALEYFEWARRIAPSIREILADPMYTNEVQEAEPPPAPRGGPCRHEARQEGTHQGPGVDVRQEQSSADRALRHLLSVVAARRTPHAASRAQGQEAPQVVRPPRQVQILHRRDPLRRQHQDDVSTVRWPHPQQSQDPKPQGQAEQESALHHAN